MFSITLFEALDAPPIEEQIINNEPIYQEPVIEIKEKQAEPEQILILPDDILLSLFERTERGVNFNDESNADQYFSSELNKAFPLDIKQEKGASVVSFEQIVKSSEDVLNKLMEEQSFMELAYEERRARFLQKLKDEQQKKIEASLKQGKVEAAEKSNPILNIFSNKKKKQKKQVEKETKVLTKVSEEKRTLKDQCR